MPQLIGPGDLIAVAWENVKKNFRPYGELVIWIVVLSVLQWTLLQISQTMAGNQLEWLFLYLLMSIPGSLAFLGLTGAMIDLTAKGLTNKKIEVRLSIYHGFRRLLPLLAVSILTSLAIFFGFFFLVIPALIFFIWFKFAPYHAVVDEMGGLASMGASRDLVTGRWWAVFLRVFVPVLFFSVAATLAEMLMYLLVGAALGDIGLFFGEAPDVNSLSRTHTLITAIIPQAIRGFAVALVLSAEIALWLDLKKKG
jgi:hypothetical protein